MVLCLCAVGRVYDIVRLTRVTVGYLLGYEDEQQLVFGSKAVRLTRRGKFRPVLAELQLFVDPNPPEQINYAD